MIAHPAVTHTSRGRHLDLLDPRPDDVDPEEIARALGNQCRYNGNVLRYYSVAEHSVHIAEHTEREGRSPVLCLAALLHDAHEAYLGDLTVPAAAVIFDGDPVALARWRAAKRRMDAVICERAGIDPGYLYRVHIHVADASILLDERDALLTPHPDPWPGFEDVVALGVGIECWPPEEAARKWLDAYYFYGGKP
jgi:hypothetical protein